MDYGPSLVFQVLKLGFFFYSIIDPGPETFDIVKVNTAVGLAGIVLPLQLFLYSRDQNYGHLFIVGGIANGIITALIYNNKLTLSKCFNYHDISHCLTAISIFLMYIGVRQLVMTEKGKEKELQID